MHIAGSALLKEAQPVGEDFSKWQLVRNLTLKEVKSNCQDRHFALKGKKAVLCLMFCETQPLVSIIPLHIVFWQIRSTRDGWNE